MTEKTHYRKAFNSPYLSSADIVERTTLTIASVTYEKDKTKKTKNHFNTAHFAEKEIRPGEPLKPMILNVTNSNVIREMAGSPFIEDWENLRVEVFVEGNVRFGNENVEGLRLAPALDSVTARELKRLKDLFQETQADEKSFLSYFKIKKLNDLPRNRFEQAITMLERKKAQK